MTKLAGEREQLAQADRDIAAGERRVLAQVLLIERLRRDGHDTHGAKLLLANLQGTLEAWRVHREEILRKIARLEETPVR
jgi:hypothetical protein